MCTFQNEPNNLTHKYTHIQIQIKHLRNLTLESVSMKISDTIPFLKEPPPSTPLYFTYYSLFMGKIWTSLFANISKPPLYKRRFQLFWLFWLSVKIRMGCPVSSHGLWLFLCWLRQFSWSFQRYSMGGYFLQLLVNFVSGFYVGIDVYIPHRKCYVKPHLFISIVFSHLCCCHNS